jgi:hypothetical protein
MSKPSSPHETSEGEVGRTQSDTPKLRENMSNIDPIFFIRSVELIHDMGEVELVKRRYGGEG